MQKKIMSIFARTPIHVGAGNSVGAIDSPVMRERHTRIPIIPGSSLKGVLADFWNDSTYQRTEEGKLLFGSDDAKNASAGQLLIGEARVLAFPVRSAKGSFAWVTCPLALQRFQRDSGEKFTIPTIDNNSMKCHAGSDVLLDGNNVVLEEYLFEFKGTSSETAAKLAELLSDDSLWLSVKNRLVIVSDEMFSYFVEQACEVVTRIRVNDETGTVDKGALFNQEQIPSETMFYSVIGAFRNGIIEKLSDKLNSSGNLLQIGGDETIGLGYCSIGLK